MAETEHYGLFVTEPSDDLKVQVWRNRLCGSQDSNMTKIDAAIAELELRALPVVTEADEDKILKVTGGVWTLVSIGNAAGEKY